MVRRWVWRGDGAAPSRALLEAVMDHGAGAAGALVARLLWNRQVLDGDAAAGFLKPTLAYGLRAPTLLKDMGRAVARLADALASGDRIAVWGDYDVDGITGAAQLVRFFRELGSEPLLHVAQRRDGYGLRGEPLRRLHAAGARVLVTADCGTADAGELAMAADLGLDVIVCDHHHAPVTRPPAWALLNPIQPGCDFPFKGLSGAGVVFYLLMGLRAELRARGRTALPDLRRYLDLVALGTVADVVPLREENRVLVSHGLRALDRTANAGLQALKETALVETASVRSIGYRLAPRLNAGGRLADARQAVDMLTTDDPSQARALAAGLEVQNAERRAIEEGMVGEAVTLVEDRAGRGTARTILVAQQGWHAGVVGIVAARLAERFHRPAVVIALDGDEGRGSGRSVRGVHLLEALGECSDLLDRFGGHRQAIGLTVRRAHIPALRDRFEEAVRRRTTPGDLEPLLEIDAETSLGTMTSGVAAALATLEPHGPGNPEPRLVARSVEVEGLRLVGDPARPHLKLRLRQDGRTLPAIGFGMGHLPVRVGDRLDVVFTPRLTSWQGVERLELDLTDVRGAAPAPGPQVGEISMGSSVS
jgi:single-stranded-DNA-specific exonuclease